MDMMIPGKKGRRRRSVPQVQKEEEENKDKGKMIPGKKGRGKRSVPHVQEAEDIIIVPMDEDSHNQGQIINYIQESDER